MVLVTSEKGIIRAYRRYGRNYGFHLRHPNYLRPLSLLRGLSLDGVAFHEIRSYDQCGNRTDMLLLEQDNQKSPNLPSSHSTRG